MENELKYLLWSCSYATLLVLLLLKKLRIFSAYIQYALGTSIYFLDPLYRADSNL